MHSYFAFFPAKADTELRTAKFIGESDIPNATFLFTEYFCTDSKCNCQRVLVKVLRADSPAARPVEVGTISYTWCVENKDKSWRAANADVPNPFLDPFHPRASYAPELLEFWHDMIQRDPAYLERIKRHYGELREAFAELSGSRRPVRQPVGAGSLSPTARRERQRKLEQLKRGRKAR